MTAVTPPITLSQALSNDPNTLIWPKDAAPILNRSLATLARERQKRIGPRFVKLSRARVAYRAQDLADYLQAQTVQTAA